MCQAGVVEAGDVNAAGDGGDEVFGSAAAGAIGAIAIIIVAGAHKEVGGRRAAAGAALVSGRWDAGAGGGVGVMHGAAHHAVSYDVHPPAGDALGIKGNRPAGGVGAVIADGHQGAEGGLAE